MEVDGGGEEEEPDDTECSESMLVSIHYFQFVVFFSQFRSLLLSINLTSCVSFTASQARRGGSRVLHQDRRCYRRQSYWKKRVGKSVYDSSQFFLDNQLSAGFMTNTSYLTAS